MRKRSWKPKDRQIQSEEAETPARAINPEKARARTFARAVKLLAAKPRSVAELRGRPQTRAEVKSLFDHLLRQGFSYELVAGKVRAISTTDIDEEDAPVD